MNLGLHICGITEGRHSNSIIMVMDDGSCSGKVFGEVRGDICHIDEGIKHIKWYSILVQRQLGHYSASTKEFAKRPKKGTSKCSSESTINGG